MQFLQGLLLKGLVQLFSWVPFRGFNTFFFQGFLLEGLLHFFSGVPFQGCNAIPSRGPF